MFIDNKYSKAYFEIIAKALENNVGEAIYERHHIVPKSLGGSNENSNLVKLSPKEHFVCHRLLVKMLSGKNRLKMSRALYLMSHSGKHSFASSKGYETARMMFIESCKGPKNWTEDGKKRLSELAKARIGEKNAFYGKSHSQDVRKLLSQKAKNRVITQEFRDKHTGKNSSRYIGEYHTPWGIFPSSSLAQKSHEYLLSATIHRWCLNPDIKILRLGKSKYLRSVGESCVGKTYRDLGFWFETKSPCQKK